jgi:hypothetical protein
MIIDSGIVTGSLLVQGPLDVSGSLSVTNGITGSLQGTASYALTSSYADNFTVGGTLSAQTIIVQTITSSIDFVTGSTRFGSNTANTHQFTGSVLVSGSLQAKDFKEYITWLAHRRLRFNLIQSANVPSNSMPV